MRLHVLFVFLTIFFVVSAGKARNRGSGARLLVKFLKLIHPVNSQKDKFGSRRKTPALILQQLNRSKHSKYDRKRNRHRSGARILTKFLGMIHSANDPKENVMSNKKHKSGDNTKRGSIPFIGKLNVKIWSFFSIEATEKISSKSYYSILINLFRNF